MGKKGKKTRWRRLPIGGTDEEGGLSLEPAAPTTDPHRVTFNEDEYTKITTPRQDVLFKKGYFGRKRAPNPSPTDTQEVHSGDSVESESYMGEEPQYVYPSGYMDPSGGVYYVNGSTFEAYDPYTGAVTVVVGPAPQYPGGPPVLAALPYQAVPLQPLEYMNPGPGWCQPLPSPYNRRKRYSTDSQNCSAQSSESPGSPQEPVDEGACAVYPPQYVYPGFMFGPPIYSMNGVTMQGMAPQPAPLPPELSTGKRRKKRRRRRRGGMTDDGSESSCCDGEEPLSCDAVGCQSETSSDADKANSDSGINTDPTPNSGSNTPPLPAHEPNQLEPQVIRCDSDSAVTTVECAAQGDVTTVEEFSEGLSTAEEDITPNLCAAAPEFSSQESTLSCLSTPSINKEQLLNEFDLLNVEESQVEVFDNCPSITDTAVVEHKDSEHNSWISNHDNLNLQPLLSSDECNEPTQNNDLKNNENVAECEEEELKAQEAEELTQNYNDKEGKTLILETLIEEINSYKSEVNNETGLIWQEEKLLEDLKSNDVKEDSEEIFQLECISALSKTPEPNMNSEFDHSLSTSHRDRLSPVPPPKRKKSLCQAAEKIASNIVEEAIRDGIQEAACLRLKSPLSITEAVTRWLNSQGSSPLTIPASDSESDDDEGIEVEEGSTDQKNVRGNPFLVPSHSGTRQRVAKDCESVRSVESAGEWDMWDQSVTRDMCDPARSVDRYYRLATDDGLTDSLPPAVTVYKTAMHIRHPGPFPCGVCCIIQ